MRGLRVLTFAALAAALAPLWSRTAAGPAKGPMPDPPSTFEGRPLDVVAGPLASRNLIEDFPGRLATLTDGERMIVWRHVVEPTRHLHALSYCYRCSGFEVEVLPRSSDDASEAWGRFRAEKDGEAVLVREVIVDAAGGRFVDVSSWWWAAAIGGSPGPWTAWAVVESAR